MIDVYQKIEKLKKEKNAVILAHNYQLPEIQDIADFTGDSLGLSLQAAKTDADMIIFCGVYFMAETAKILSPQKKVIIPDKDSGCPLAAMITADQLRELKLQHPNAKTMCYVNTSADVKAECDFCCTSANAEQILKEAFSEKDEIIFVPDKNLASYASQKAKRNVIIWKGYCSSHAMILPEHILQQKEKYPEAKVMSHPECNKAVLALSDVIVSTSGMLRYAKESDAREFIVGTENGMLYPLSKANPEKRFYPASEVAVCPNMKKITLAKVIASLEVERDEVTLPEEIIEKAKKSIQRMISVQDKQRADSPQIQKTV